MSIRLYKFPVERPNPGGQVMVFKGSKATSMMGIATAIETRAGVALLLDGKIYDSNHELWWNPISRLLAPEFDYQYRFIGADGAPACQWVSIPEESIATITAGAGRVQIRKLQVLSVTDYYGGDL